MEANPPAQTGYKWHATARPDGTLERNGALGDMLSWVIEHDGKVVHTQKANLSFTYRYSRVLAVRAWLVETTHLDKIVSNIVSFNPPRLQGTPSPSRIPRLPSGSIQGHSSSSTDSPTSEGANGRHVTMNSVVSHGISDGDVSQIVRSPSKPKEGSKVRDVCEERGQVVAMLKQAIQQLDEHKHTGKGAAEHNKDAAVHDKDAAVHDKDAAVQMPPKNKDADTGGETRDGSMGAAERHTTAQCGNDEMTRAAAAADSQADVCSESNPSACEGVESVSVRDGQGVLVSNADSVRDVVRDQDDKVCVVVQEQTTVCVHGGDAVNAVLQQDAQVQGHGQVKAGTAHECVGEAAAAAASVGTSAAPAMYSTSKIVHEHADDSTSNNVQAKSQASVAGHCADTVLCAHQVSNAMPALLHVCGQLETALGLLGTRFAEALTERDALKAAREGAGRVFEEEMGDVEEAVVLLRSECEALRVKVDEADRQGALLLQQLAFAKAAEGEALAREREVRRTLEMLKKDAEGQAESDKAWWEKRVSGLRDDVERAEERARAAEEEMHDLRARLEWEQQASVRLQRRAKEVEEDAERNIEREKKASEEARADGERQLEVAYKETERVKGLVLDLERQVAACEREIGVSKESQERTEALLAQVRRSLRDAEMREESVRSEKDRACHELCEAQDKLREAEVRAESVKEELNVLKDELQATQTAWEHSGMTVREDLQEAERMIRMERDMRDMDRAKETAVRQQLERQLAAVTEELEEWKHRVVEYTKESSTFKDDAHTLDRMRIAVVETESKYKKQMDDMQAAMERKREELTSVCEEKVEVLRRRVCGLEQALRDKEEEGKELSEAMEELEELTERSKGEHEALRAELQARLKASEQRVQELSEANSAQFASVQAQRDAKECEELRQLLTKQREKFDQSQRESAAREKDLRHALSEVKKQCAIHKKKAADAEGAVGRDGGRVALLQSAVGRLESMLEKVENERDTERRLREDTEGRVVAILREGVDVFERASLKWLKPWPIWLRALSLPAFESLLPRVHVTLGGRVNGVTLYALNVVHACDVRGSWVLQKRYSNMCALHESLCKEVVLYGAHPAEEGKRLLAEKRRAWFGTGEAIAQERTAVAQAFFEVLTKTVELLASRSLCVFLDLRVRAPCEPCEGDAHNDEESILSSSSQMTESTQPGTPNASTSSSHARTSDIREREDDTNPRGTRRDAWSQGGGGGGGVTVLFGGTARDSRTQQALMTSPKKRDGTESGRDSLPGPGEVKVAGEGGKGEVIVGTGLWGCERDDGAAVMVLQAE